MAGTTPMTTLIEEVPSFIQISKREFGPVWARTIWLTNSRFISLAPSVGNGIFVLRFETTVSINFYIQMESNQILQSWLNKFRLLRPSSKSLPDKIKKWSYESNRRRTSLKAIRKMKGIVIEGVTAKDLLLQMKKIQISFERWGRRWTSWRMLSKRKQTEVRIDWSEKLIHLSLRQFWLPQLEPFDGLKDPQDHLDTFKTTLGLQQPPNEILCHSFPTTLKGAAREWFTKLPSLSVDNFK